ncbi:dihydroorotate dehydrogenase [Halovulum sp. GXIMD14793]
MVDKQDIPPDLDKALSQGFDELRRDTPDLSAGLMGRLMADATAAQRPRGLARLAAVCADLLAQIGGQGVAVALTASALLGIWLGYAQPITLGTTADVQISSDTATAEPFAMFDDFVQEI